MATFRKMALAFPGAVELPHFEKASFRASNKIFATLDIVRLQVCIKLNKIEQSVFCSIETAVIYPVNNKWGKQGWTIVELQKVKKALLKDALSKSYEAITTPKKTQRKPSL